MTLKEFHLLILSLVAAGLVFWGWVYITLDVLENPILYFSGPAVALYLAGLLFLVDKPITKNLKRRKS